jgi:hypothetical protein
MRRAFFQLAPDTVETARECKRARHGFCNDVDPVTLEPLSTVPAETLVRFRDADGEWAMAASSLEQLLAHAHTEGVKPVNPFNGKPLQGVDSRPVSASLTVDALAERPRPTPESTWQLARDVTVRLQAWGVFVRPELLWEQRTGRMRLIFGALQRVFAANFTESERCQLAPPAGRLSDRVPGWATWAQWGQTTLLAMLRFSGERSEASPVLKKRAAEYCLAALGMVIPEIAREIRGSVEIRSY